MKPEPAPETILEGRDLSNYELGGRFYWCDYYDQTNANCEDSERARQFILENWKAKRRAYVILDWHFNNTWAAVHVFIEPDEQNVWHVVLRKFADRWDFKGNIGASYAQHLRRKTATDSDYPVIRRTKFLIFFNKEGEEVYRY